MSEIPEREQLIHTDRELRESLERGMRQAAAGDTQSRGSFSRYTAWWTRFGPIRAIWIAGAFLIVVAALINAALLLTGHPSAPLAIAVLVASALNIVANIVDAIRSRRQTRNMFLDVKVVTVVRADPGHCSTTYAHALGAHQPDVKKSLKRLARQGDLTVTTQRYLDDVSAVEIYSPKGT